MKTFTVIAKVCIRACALGAAAIAAATVKEEIAGPGGPDVRYAMSDLGVHLAAVARKGSRLTVVVDGVVGPKFDEIVAPVAAWIDPRPLQLTGMGSISSRHGADQRGHSGLPVTFSKDGSRYAYVARRGEEWILVADNKEVLHLPVAGAVGATGGLAGSAGNTDVRLEFTGETGKHLLFARSVYLGYELWVDGQKWPGYYSSGGSGAETIDPLISPDGEHVAYVAQMDRDHRALIVDGRDAGYFGTNLQFTPDSRHLISIAPTAKGTTIQVDGHPLFSAKQLLAVYCAPTGNRIAAILTHEYPDHSTGQFAIVDGRPVEATLCKAGIKKFVFSPDGKHYAAVCSESGTVFFVVSDGKKGEVYDMMGDVFANLHGGGVAYSPDSTKLVYLAHGANKFFVVVNDDESDAFDSIPDFAFSATGGHVVYAGIVNGAANSPIVIDGKAERLERSVPIDNFDFSPNGARYAYFSSAVHVDGTTLPIAATNFLFSSDSQHIAVVGYRPADNKRGIWVDGELVYSSDRDPRHIAFSGDGQHLFWLTMEAATGPNAAPGTYEQVTYADGKAVARADYNQVGLNLTMPVGYGMFTVHPGWQAVGPSSLIWLGPVGSDVKRFTITPSDTNVGTMIADAQAAAKAAADAAAQAQHRRK